jgi:NAD(P)-dependent dehydrogenase (short-subunit alcohol dehydrogenase family)
MNIIQITKMKTIIINGGTKGVGKEIVLACLNIGYNVIFGGRDEIAAEKILKSVNSDNCNFVKIDNLDINSLNDLFSFAIDKYKQVDGYVHYAGITPVSGITNCDEETYDEVFDINLKSAFFCTQFAIKHMQKSGGGSIIYFGSAHMDYGQIDRTAYAITKGALNILSSHIAHHYAKYQIRSNYIVMGWTDTDGEIELRESQGISQAELKKEASKIIPMGRMLNVYDPIPTVLHFLSDDSSMITGSVVRITGGEFI